MGSYQVFHRKPTSYIFKFFVAIVFTLNLSVELNYYGYQGFFSWTHIVMFGGIVWVLAMAIWELNTPLVSIEGEFLVLNLTMLDSMRTIELSRVAEVDINCRYTFMTLLDDEDNSLRIPLNQIKGAANRDVLIDIVEEKIEVFQKQGRRQVPASQKFQEFNIYTNKYAKQSSI